MNEPYTIKRSSMRCSKSKQNLEPGDVYYSVLVETEDGFERIEIGEAQWTEAPDGSVGWWKCKVPDLDGGKVYWAPSEVIVNYFDRIMNQDNNDEIRYVLALLLIRKRLARQSESVFEATEEGFIEITVNRLNQKYKIPIVQLAVEKVKSIENELCQNLFTDRPISSVD